MASKRFPILGKGELLTKQASLNSGYGPPPVVWTFEQAQERLVPQLEATIRAAEEIPAKSRLRSGIFFAVDLDHKFLAKSYYPNDYFDKAGWELTGSIKITQTGRDNNQFDKPMQARRLFFKAPVENLNSALYDLKSGEYRTQAERKGPVRINHIQMVSPKGKIIGLDSFEEGRLIEVIVHPMREADWQEFQDSLFDVVSRNDYPTSLFNWVLGGEYNMPRFVPVQTDKGHCREIASLNPVRAIRAMPGISYPRINCDKEVMAATPPISTQIRSGPLPSVGVFDGGVDASIPHLGRWVVPVELTSSPVEQDFLAHGTAVCGAVLYGNAPDKECKEPAFSVKSFRVLPEPRNPAAPGLGLYQLVKLIEETVRAPENRAIKTYVLSFGPDQPIEDEEVNLFTATLDRLAFERDVLFVVAVGNSGEFNPPYNRIQPPADAVNGLGVGAYILDEEGKPVRARYSSTGPGRSGNAVKPDIHMFGGDHGQPFCVFEPGGNGKCGETMGTSFSAPLACGVAGSLLYRVDNPEMVTSQTAKALMIHRAFQEGWGPDQGWGPLSNNLDELMTCSQSNVTLLFNGKLPLGRRTLLEVPFFQDIADKGTVRLSWTLVYATDVAPSMPDEYTLGGAQVRFRPNCDVFTYRLGKSTKRVDSSSDPALYGQLIREKKLKKTALPKTDSTIQFNKSLFMTEEQRRNSGVWDTTKHFWTKWKRFSSIKNPIIDIHAQARSDWYYDPLIRPSDLTYACVVSIELSNQKLPLYQMIRERVPELVEVRLRNRGRVRI